MQECHNAGMHKGSGVALALLRVCIPALLTSACFGAQAKTIAVSPLDMPAPPPRVVEVSTAQAPPPMSLPEEPAIPHRPARVRRRRTGPRAAAGRTSKAGSRPSSPPSRPTRPADPRRPLCKPHRLSRKAKSNDEFELSSARRAPTWARINYQALNADARTQYDTAKRFIAQAEEAARDKNLVFASNLAEKAALLAAQLAGR